MRRACALLWILQSAHSFRTHTARGPDAAFGRRCGGALPCGGGGGASTRQDGLVARSSSTNADEVVSFEERDFDDTPDIENAGLGDALKDEATKASEKAAGWFEHARAVAAAAGSAARPSAELEAARAMGAAALAGARLPTRTDEPWRFTNLNRLFAMHLAAEPSTSDTEQEQLRAMVARAIEGVDAAATIVLVDGRLDAELSVTSSSDGLFAGSVIDALAAGDAVFAGDDAAAADDVDAAALGIDPSVSDGLPVENSPYAHDATTRQNIAVARPPLATLRDLLLRIPERGEPAPLRSAHGLEALAALNSATLHDAAAIVATKAPTDANGADTAGPLVHVIYAATGAPAADPDAAAADPLGPDPYASANEVRLNLPRLVVVAGGGAALRLQQTHLSVDPETAGGAPGGAGARHLTNSMAQIVLQPGSTLDHQYSLCVSPAAVHLDTTTVAVGEDSNYTMRSAMLGGALGRVCTEVDLAARGASFEVDALSLAAARQQLDYRLSVFHTAPDCKSMQRIRCVAGGRAEAIFKGRINVPREGAGADAQQLCRSLLLTDQATVNVMPSLEVVADDVACSHGATVADLDGDSLFYLLSRGIKRPLARSLLVRAFVAEVLGPQKDLPPALADSVTARLFEFGAQEEAIGRRSVGYKYTSI